jgi:transposase
MSMARLVVTAVRVQGRPISQVARDYGVSRRWVHELVRRYDRAGEAGLAPRSRRPHTSPQAIAPTVEEQIVALRNQLTDQGLDAGAQTIAYHLTKQGTPAPSPATIWRVLTRRGLITPQPQKRPRSSWKRFAADQPNECWQADLTHWALADSSEVEILNLLDDHARLAWSAPPARCSKPPTYWPP